MAFKGQGQEEKNSLEEPFEKFFNVLCKKPGSVIYSGDIMHGKSACPTIDKLFLEYVVNSQKQMIRNYRCKVVSNWCKEFQKALQNHVKEYMNEINKLKESLDLSNTESIRNFKGKIIELYQEAHGELAKILKTMIEKSKDAVFDGEKQKTDLYDLQSFLEEQLKKFNELKYEMTEENLSNILHLDKLEAEGKERNKKAFKISVREFKKYFHLNGSINNLIEPLNFIKITIIHMRPKDKKYLSTPQKAFYDAFAHFPDTNINKWCDEFDKRLLDHHNEFYTRFKTLSKQAEEFKKLEAERCKEQKKAPKKPNLKDGIKPAKSFKDVTPTEGEGQKIIAAAAHLFDDAKDNLISIFGTMRAKLEHEFQTLFDALVKDFNDNQLKRPEYLDKCMFYFGLDAIVSSYGGPQVYKTLRLL